MDSSVQDGHAEAKSAIDRSPALFALMDHWLDLDLAILLGPGSR